MLWLSGIIQADGKAIMLGHLIVESSENKTKQEMYESEFNLIVICLIKREDSKRRKGEIQT